MTNFDYPESPQPEPPRPAPPRRRTNSVPATLLTLLAVGALVGGIALGRATNSGSSNASNSAATFTPGSGNSNSSANNGNSGSNGNSNPFNGGSNPFNNGGSSSNNSGSTGNSSTGNPNTDAIVSKVSPWIVNIDTVVGSSGEAAGTGMIVSSSGEVLTNNHVIDGATQISVQFQDGSTHSAKVLGYDSTNDVALIKVSGVSNLPTISTSGSSSLSVGDPVVALGNAGGKGGAPTVATGSITDLNQTITASDDSGENAETLHGLIQINAPIQPGDSGGPLVNTDGKVIGMDSAASTDSGFGFRQAAATEGFAIPIDNALQIAQQIDAGHATATIHIGDRGILGVGVQPDSSTSGGSGFGNLGGGNGSSSGNGAVVATVQSGSPADNAGISANDTIVAVAGNSVSSSAALEQAMNSYHPGDKVSVTWVDSSGSRHSATLTLISGPPA
jgi:S1-C subfamily serine protease